MTLVANRRSVMTVFSSPTCPESHRCRIVLAEKDITVDVIDIDPNDLPEDLSDINPYNSVPTLIDRDLVLYDARVIIEYLDERFPHPPLMPVDPVSRAYARLALFRIENDWYTLVDDLESGDEKRAEAARKRLREGLIASNEIFESMPFFLSDQYSLVDASLAPILWRLPHWGIQLPPKQARAVLAYADRIFSRPGFQQSLSEAEREMRG
ncbi:MAG: stringent starvation protein A [Gammaproteobacteria bacterium]|nr:MAG: stringent starvation protein A [Gammaproteobacteria bacterium]